MGVGFGMLFPKTRARLDSGRHRRKPGESKSKQKPIKSWPSENTIPEEPLKRIPTLLYKAVVFRRTGSRVRSKRIMEGVKSMEQIFEKIIAFIKMLLSMIGMI
ncbi:MAG: hypothetical protein ACLR7D_16510 [Lachnospira eligens]